MTNSKVRDLNQMKSPQQQQNTDVSKSPGSSDAKAPNQQASIPSRQQDTQTGQHSVGSDKQGKNGTAQQK
jgi:hypothetical protein